MYYQNYEEYMRKVLGYTLENQNTYEINCYGNFKNTVPSYQKNKEIEDCYPEIYKIIMPVVCQVCDKCNISITKDIVENMVEEVYHKIENNSEIVIKNSTDNRNNEVIRRNLDVETRKRITNNPFLKDLIKILILNRLLTDNLHAREYYPRIPNYTTYL